MKLRSTAGKIRLQYVDEQMALRKSLQEEQKRRLEEKLRLTSLAGFSEPDPSGNATTEQHAAGAAPCAGADWWG
ncbi:hypothetical protein, partial [Pseudomonas sp. GP01-A1]|uniref:hypothetical protein n=1 Tax=Pseudomonas sp. GP01-A1 TaxID=2070570 RepID=UPI001C466FDE